MLNQTKNSFFFSSSKELSSSEEANHKDQSLLCEKFSISS